MPDLRFETIPDGLPPLDIETTHDQTSLCNVFATNFLTPSPDFVQFRSRYLYVSLILLLFRTL